MKITIYTLSTRQTEKVYAVEHANTMEQAYNPLHYYDTWGKTPKGNLAKCWRIENDKGEVVAKYVW